LPLYIVLTGIPELKPAIKLFNMKFNSRLSIVVTALFFTTCLHAQPVSKSDAELIGKVDKLLAAVYKPNETGATVLIARKGTVLYKKALGMANLELDVPMQIDHVFRIGSISKQFTAVAILQLFEKGKLNLQDDIKKFIPDYPTHGYTITVEHLLNHTSGIKSYTSMNEWDDQVRRKDFTPAALVDYFKNQPMDFSPGTKWEYNNSGYFLLGFIIEKISGQTYQEYIKDNIFKPLSMTNSYYGDHIPLIKNRVSGYEPSKDGVANADFLSMTQPYAAGSLLSTVEDLFKWHQAVHSYKLVKKEILDKAFVSSKLLNGKSTNYGYGWFMGNLQGSPTIEHSGGINGSLTNAIYLPNEDVFVTVFSNCTCKPPSEVSTKIAGLLINKPFGEHKEITVAGIDLNKYTGVYENENGEQRTIRIDSNKLTSQRGGGTVYKIKPYANNKYFFENSMSLLEFTADATGKITGHKFSSGTEPETYWNKTNKSIAAEPKVKQVSEKVLNLYIGEYELQPKFIITVSTEGNKLFAQATGQPKFELFATSDTEWFLKAVDAKLEFIKDETGKVIKLVLNQGGQKMDGKKIK
jgi:CubicO group peptidase (beta-lactamase class C family)